MRNLLHPLYTMLICLTQQELARQIAYLKEENRILRARLPEHIKTKPAERRRLIRAGRKIGADLKQLMTLVTYRTFQRWIREAEEQHANGSADTTERKSGRPRTADDIRKLVLRIRCETGYGYTKIRQTLRNLGIRISHQTVKNILKEAGYGTDPNRSTDSWDAFLNRHAESLWQLDFVTKPMWTKNGLIDLFVIVGLHLGTRRMWVSPCTASPNENWVKQQGRQFLMDADDVELPPKLVIHDRDTKFTNKFDELLESSGATVKKTPVMSPNLQAHVERAIQTLKHECLNHFVIVHPSQLNRITSQFQAWYNFERGHTACDDLPPGCDEPPEVVGKIEPRDVACTARLGGLLKHYWRRAA